MTAFPGEEIAHREGIALALHARLDPEVIAAWQSLGPHGPELDEFLTADRYYIFHEHPVHRFKDRLFLAARADVIPFLRRTFCAARGEGLDRRAGLSPGTVAETSSRRQHPS
jgi:hypothetical protein